MPQVKTRGDSLRLYWTGADSPGAVQNDPDLSLGGYRADHLIEPLDVSIESPIDGIIIRYVSGANGQGEGVLEATGGDTLQWTPPDGTPGPEQSLEPGEEILVQGDDPAKWVRVERSTSDSLSGTATLHLDHNYDNVIGFDNITSSQAEDGREEVRAICVKNVALLQTDDIAFAVRPLGPEQTSDDGHLPSSGDGTIGTTGSFSDWPDHGIVRIEEADGTLRELAYYHTKTSSELTVKEDHRAALGTSESEGASDDVVYPVPPLRIGQERPDPGDTRYVPSGEDAPEFSPFDGISHIHAYWDSVTGATEYEIEVYDNSDYSGDPEVSTSTSDTYYLIEDLPSQSQWWWRWRAMEDDSASTEWDNRVASEDDTQLVQIDGEGTPNTFRWSLDGGSTWVETGVDVTTDEYLLQGSYVLFPQTSGYLDGESWEDDSLSDASFTGSYLGSEINEYVVEIDDDSDPDSFRWSPDGGTTWEETGVEITGDEQSLGGGLSIDFDSTSGHQMGESWLVTGDPKVAEASSEIDIPDSSRVTWTSAVEYSEGVDIGSLKPEQQVFLWLRRTTVSAHESSPSIRHVIQWYCESG